MNVNNCGKCGGTGGEMANGILSAEMADLRAELERAKTRLREMPDVCARAAVSQYACTDTIASPEQVWTVRVKEVKL